MGRKIKDYTGQNCGCWYVIERDLNPASKSHETFWKCECQRCKTKASVRKTDLDKNPRSCNNCKGEIIRETMEEKGATVWHIGDVFGHLTIIGRGIPKNNHSYVLVKCDCGTSEPFEVRVEHLKGQSHGRTISCGCASESSGELKIRQLLEKNDIKFEKQYRVQINEHLHIFDFVLLNEQNDIIKFIEFDGEQHYRPVELFGGEEAYKKQQIRDKEKEDYCAEINIPLLRIPYYSYDDINLGMLIE